MYILGVGAAYPDTLLDRDTLVSLVGEPRAEDSDLLSRVGATRIATTMNVEYLKRTGNRDVLEAWENASHSPTDLGIAAVQKALVSAGITMEHVGLVLGTTSTPYQTCPSEAQRITGKFGVKIPCYDIVGGMAALPLYIETLMSWKPERLPDYVVCVFTDCPTQYVNYAEASAAPFIFGDAASAMVISTRSPGKLKIVSSYLKKSATQKPIIEITRTVSLRAENLLPALEVRRMMAACVTKLESENKLEMDQLLCVGPELFYGDCVQAAAEMNLPKENLLSSTAVRGYSLGSAPLCALADKWESIVPQQSVAVVHGGDGVWSSSLLCACE